MRRWLYSIFVLICVGPVTVLAQQQNTCPEIVAQAIQAADQACQDTARNQACYGNINLSAQPSEGVESFRFERVGDKANVADIQALRLSAMDLDSGDWGVALLRLQANLPDTLPGQNVTFLLFGDVEMINATNADPNLRPMQAFYLKTGSSDAQCAEAPDSGLLVQTPAGVGTVAFTVNGVNVDMGSTVFFQSHEETGMSVTTLEGAAYVAANGEQQVVVPGTRVTIPIGSQRVPLRTMGGVLSLPVFRATEPPGTPRSYRQETDSLGSLPFSLLERDISVADPLSPGELMFLQSRIDRGELCGRAPLPDCDDYGAVIES